MSLSDMQLLPRMARVLVGESVYEDATVTINNGVLWVEFDADDLASVAIDLGKLEGDQ